MMKKSLSVLLPLTCWSGLSFAVPFAADDIESLAMGGAGVASASKNASLSNPALIVARERSHRDFSLLVSGHLLVEDPDKLKDGLGSFKAVARTDAASALARLNALENKTQQQYSHASGMVVLSSANASSALFVNNYGFSGSRVTVNNDDRIDLGGGTIPTDYKSKVSIRGADFVEAGVSFAKHATFPGLKLGEVLFGISPKVVVGKVYNQDTAVDKASIGDMNASGATNSRLTLDLGVAKEFGRLWTIGLVARNLVPGKFGDKANHVILGPQLRAGIAQHQRWGTLALDLDLWANGAVGYLGKTQFLSLGVDAGPTDSWRVRAGYKHDLQGSAEDVLSAGVGIDVSIFKVDAVILKSNTGEGAALQLGMAF